MSAAQLLLRALSAFALSTSVVVVAQAPAPAAPAAAPASAPAAEKPVVEVSMTLNVDYQKLSADDKDQLKGKIVEVLAKNAGVDQSAVAVTLTPGSVKVDAKIQTADANAAKSMEKSMDMDVVGKNVMEVALTIPGVKAAAGDVLKVTNLEDVVMTAGLTPAEVNNVNLNSKVATHNAKVAKASLEHAQNAFQKTKKNIRKITEAHGAMEKVASNIKYIYPKDKDDEEVKTTAEQPARAGAYQPPVLMLFVGLMIAVVA